MSNKGINIANEINNHIYSGTKLTTKDFQPIYILHRDTIRTFLHETHNDFALNSKILAYFSIEVTLIVTLITASFHDVSFLKKGTILGIFFVSALVVFFYLIKNIVSWYKNKEKLTINNLTKELGKRGSVIENK